MQDCQDLQAPKCFRFIPILRGKKKFHWAAFPYQSVATWQIIRAQWLSFGQEAIKGNGSNQSSEANEPLKASWEVILNRDESQVCKAPALAAWRKQSID